MPVRHAHLGQVTDVVDVAVLLVDLAEVGCLISHMVEQGAVERLTGPSVEHPVILVLAVAGGLGGPLLHVVSGGVFRSPVEVAFDFATDPRHKGQNSSPLVPRPPLRGNGNNNAICRSAATPTTIVGVMTRASVIVRAKDKEATIEATLRAVRNQTVDVEPLVVVSGSRDGTLEIARRWADRVIEIPSHEFSYGHALNVGAAEATGPFHFALSAHCVPPHTAWIEASIAHYACSSVAATCGALETPDFQALLRPFAQTADTVLKNPYWGYSIHAGSWRAEVWQADHFDEQMDAAEDK